MAGGSRGRASPSMGNKDGCSASAPAELLLRARLLWVDVMDAGRLAVEAGYPKLRERCCKLARICMLASSFGLPSKVGAGRKAGTGACGRPAQKRGQASGVDGVDWGRQSCV